RSAAASLHAESLCAIGNVRRRVHHGQTARRADIRSRPPVAREFSEVVGEISASSESAPARRQTSVTRYEHTQIGHVIIWSLLPIIVIASGGFIGSSPHRGPPVVVSIILLVCLVLFYKLRITIDGETLDALVQIGRASCREREYDS